MQAEMQRLHPMQNANMPFSLIESIGKCHTPDMRVICKSNEGSILCPMRLEGIIESKKKTPMTCKSMLRLLWLLKPNEWVSCRLNRYSVLKINSRCDVCEAVSLVLPQAQAMVHLLAAKACVRGPSCGYDGLTKRHIEAMFLDLPFILRQCKCFLLIFLYQKLIISIGHSDWYTFKGRLAHGI